MKEKIPDLMLKFSIRLVYSILFIYLINRMETLLENGCYIAINPFTIGITMLFGIPGIIFMILIEMIR